MDFTRFKQLYTRAGLPLALIAVGLMPLKLAAAYVALVPLLLLWLCSRDWGKFRIPRIAVPLLVFIVVALLSSFFGIQPFRSLPKFLNLTFFALSILAFADISERHGAEKVLFASLWGQAVASLNGIAQGAAFSDHFPRFFLGAVTQSGQLAIQVPIALGLATWFAFTELPNRGGLAFGPFFRSPRLATLGAFNFAVASLLGFAAALNLDLPAKLEITAILLAGIATAAIMARDKDRRNAALLLGILVPLLVAALLVNLKRGPWLGTLVGVSVFIAIYARALIAPLVLAVLGTFVLFEPIRSRLALSAEHFFISGGRNVMWQIGTEFATRFPLGIGYHNSPFLRHFSVEIPPQHNHFHNNFLNILVETGWFGLGAFLWWIGRMLNSAFGTRGWNRADILGCALGCAILSWQVAGIVEYSFGDSEVVNLVWVMIGTLVAIRADSRAAAPVTTAESLEPSSDITAAAAGV